jgi:hypothetical protein
LPERIANKIILAEDTAQQNLVRRYLERCGHTAPFRLVPLPARGPGGSGEKYIREQYPREVQACRSILGRRAAALLVAIVDADMETTRWRATQLANALQAAAMPARRSGEPIVVLIPKRHVETWIRALLGDQVDEVTDYTQPTPTPKEIKDAAGELHRWTRPGASAAVTSPPSLTASLLEWRKIPS